MQEMREHAQSRGYGRGEREDRGERRGREGRGGHGGHGSHGGRGGKKSSLLEELLQKETDMHLLFVGSVSCLRHKPFRQAASLMSARRLSVLCPSMSDFATGRYINQVKEAVLELSEELGTKHFTLIHGCQWVILSTDGGMLADELAEHGIELLIRDDSHLECGDHN